MTVLRARKVMKDSKILAATRMTSTVSVSAPDSIIDPEVKITERFGTRIRYVSAHELLDQIPTTTRWRTTARRAAVRV